MGQKKLLDLSGKWDFITDEEKQYEKQSIFYDELPIDWGKIHVPGHWQTGGYEGYQGTVWYRKHFTIAEQPAGRIYLQFGAVDYFSEVWLNGIYLGFHEGDFDSFFFDITEKLRFAQTNVLYVKATSEIDKRPEHKEIAKGGIYHWDCLPIRQQGLTDCPEVPSAANSQYPNPLINPGGIWKGVVIISEEHGAIDDIQVTSFLNNNYQIAEVFAEFTYRHHRLAEQLEMTLELTPFNFSGESIVKTIQLTAKSGTNHYTYSISVENPKLWWPWDLGHPSLYTLQITLYAGENIIDQRSIRCGIREIKRDDSWGMYLNGKRFFARGTNYLSDQFLSLVNDETYQKDIQLILDANMNMIRVFAHMEKEHFYEMCDEKGIMVFQDLPFQWGYANDGLFINRAKEIAKKTVLQLYSHPSIVLWSCHSESRFHDYNKLDNVLMDMVSQLDPTRILHKNSVLIDRGDIPAYFKGFDEFAEYVPRHLSVFWVGWYWGEVEDTEAYNPLFVTEFGTQSVPNEDSLRKFFEEPNLWPPNWDEWRRRGFQTNFYQKNLGEFPENLQELIEKTQKFQSYFYKTHIEAWRRKKYKDVNGLLQFHLVNTWPGIDWSVVDYYRQPKDAYFTIQKAFHPLMVTTKADSAVEDANGWTFECSSWVINDYHQMYEGTKLLLEVEDGTGNRLLREQVLLDPIGADVSEEVYTFTVSSRTKQIVVKTRWLSNEGIVLANNQNNLVPPKDLSDIEDPVKAKVGL